MKGAGITHHVRAVPQDAPAHVDQPLNHMMKPGIGTYDKFKQLFEKYTQGGWQEAVPHPYFIAAHPGTSEDMMNWPSG